MIEDLQHIGDALELAIARDVAASRNNVTSLRHVPVDHTDSPEEATVLTETSPIVTLDSRRRRVPRRTVVIVAALATLGIGGVAAATAIHLSSDEVSHGLPGGSAIFEGTGPSCATTGDGNVFTCTLASAPTQDVETNYTGTLETFVDGTSHIAGGCIGDTADGLHWTCYAGQLAVDKGIMVQDMLGLLQTAPSHG
ncbi:MAG: hypothetical protein JWM34_3544 [Ilumatobacteraceae bacterium]|nr:hypothetical protein [Ilumatobacteraceae bacterium]